MLITIRTTRPYAPIYPGGFGAVGHLQLLVDIFEKMFDHTTRRVNCQLCSKCWSVLCQTARQCGQILLMIRVDAVIVNGVSNRGVFTIGGCKI